MFRKQTIRALVFLLAALPLLGVLAQGTEAASSRVAVISELKGTVQVKKAGGSKTFRAFAKLSLNEGDTLITGDDSYAVLQFANGTSKDDTMTTSENTTLTFSKLSDKKGTRTKVSMLKGSAWVDVKSIETQSDEFQLETPTAIMGVRGTNFWQRVDPLTGTTTLVVASGIVRTEKPNRPPSEATFVYPSQQVTLTPQPVDSPSNPVTPHTVQIEDLIGQASPQEIEAIIRSAAEIQQEHDELKKRLQNAPDNPSDPAASKSQDEWDRLFHNIDQLIGNIAQTALRSGKLSPGEIQDLIEKANQQIEDPVKKIDLSKVEPFKQSDADRDAAEAAKQAMLETQRRVEEQVRLLQERQRQKNELLQKVRDAKKTLEEANRKTIEEEKSKAEERLKEKLDEAARRAFEEAKRQRELELNPTPAPTPPPATGGDAGTDNPPPLNSNANLQSLVLKTWVQGDDGDDYVNVLATSFSPTTYAYTIPAGLYSSYTIKAIPADAGARVTRVLVDADPIEPSPYYPDEYMAYVVDTDAVITVEVTAASGAKQTYTVSIRQPLPDGLAGWTFTAGTKSYVPRMTGKFENGGNVYALEVGSTIDRLDVTIDFGETADYAVMTYYPESEGNGPTPPLEAYELYSGVAQEIEAPNSVYNQYQIELFKNETLVSRHLLWIVKGLSTPNWNNWEAFIAATVEDAEGEISPLALQALFNRVSPAYDRLHLSDPNDEDPFSFSLFVPPIEEFCYSYDDSCQSIPVWEGMNEYMILVSDKSGLYRKTYTLEVMLADPAPAGLIDWSLRIVGEGDPTRNEWIPAPDTENVYKADVWVNFGLLYLDFNLQSGQTGQLYDATGTIKLKDVPAGVSSYEVPFRDVNVGFGYYRYQLKVGGNTYRLIVNNGSGSYSLNEDMIAVTQEGQSVPVRHAVLDAGSGDLFVVHAEDATRPLRFQLTADIGDLKLIEGTELEPLAGSPGVYELPIFEPGLHVLEVRIYEPIQNAYYESYPLRVYYGELPSDLVVQDIEVTAYNGSSTVTDNGHGEFAVALEGDSDVRLTFDTPAEIIAVTVQSGGYGYPMLSGNELHLTNMLYGRSDYSVVVRNTEGFIYVYRLIIDYTPGAA